MDRDAELLLDDTGSSPEHNAENLLQLQTHIHNLIQAQPFAVLCTQGSGQPYGSVIAYAMGQNLKTAVFATSKATQKYRFLAGCSNIALIIDSRPARPDDLMQAEAITATGQAVELSSSERDAWAKLLTDRHPQLRTFVDNPSTAVFKVIIRRYLYVSHFQEVQYLDLTKTASIEEIV